MYSEFVSSGLQQFFISLAFSYKFSKLSISVFFGGAAKNRTSTVGTVDFHRLMMGIYGTAAFGIYKTKLLEEFWIF